MIEAILEYEELCEMCLDCKIMGKDRIVFDGKNRARVRELGQIIHDKGGLHFMKVIANDVFLEMRPDLGDATARRDIVELSQVWEGIGRWVDVRVSPSFLPFS